MIILVGGYKKSGKDTVARYISSFYDSERYAFADPIREILKIAFDWDDENFTNGKKNVIDEKIGISPRWAMQWIGTDIFQYKICEDFPFFEEKIGRTIWAKKVLIWKEKNNIENLVISDWRFPHEQETILNNINEKVISIRINNNRINSIDKHGSETNIPLLEPDVEIYNNGSFKELYDEIDEKLINIIY